jgi:hypothetical protein
LEVTGTPGVDDFFHQSDVSNQAYQQEEPLDAGDLWAKEQEH